MRYYGALGGGYANVTVVNAYKFNSVGTARWGLADYDEKMEANAIEAHGEMGLETLFTDNVTFLCGIGYPRYLMVPKLKYKGDVNTIQNPGGVLKGDTRAQRRRHESQIEPRRIFCQCGVSLLPELPLNQEPTCDLSNQ